MGCETNRDHPERSFPIVHVEKECREDMAHISNLDLAREILGRGDEGVILVNLPSEGAMVFMTSSSPGELFRMATHIRHVANNMMLAQEKPDEHSGT